MYTALWTEDGKDGWDRFESEDELLDFIEDLTTNKDVCDEDIYIFLPQADSYATDGYELKKEAGQMRTFQKEHNGHKLTITVPDYTINYVNMLLSDALAYKEKYGGNTRFTEEVDDEEDYGEILGDKVNNPDEYCTVDEVIESLENCKQILDDLDSGKDDILWDNVVYKKNGTFKRTVKPILWEAVNGYYSIESYGWRTECLRIEAEDDTTACVCMATITESAC